MVDSPNASIDTEVESIETQSLFVWIFSNALFVESGARTACDKVNCLRHIPGAAANARSVGVFALVPVVWVLGFAEVRIFRAGFAIQKRYALVVGVAIV